MPEAATLYLHGHSQFEKKRERFNETAFLFRMIAFAIIAASTVL